MKAEWMKELDELDHGKESFFSSSPPAKNNISHVFIILMAHLINGLRKREAPAE